MEELVPERGLLMLGQHGDRQCLLHRGTGDVVALQQFGEERWRLLFDEHDKGILVIGNIDEPHDVHWASELLPSSLTMQGGKWSITKEGVTIPWKAAQQVSLKKVYVPSADVVVSSTPFQYQMS